LIERKIREVEAGIQWFQEALDQESLPASDSMHDAARR
jgi:hypothetical protein